MSKALTIELIHMKTKTNRIDSIKSLNLWGNDLDDISIVTQMSHIEVLSLAVNYIQTLKDIQGCYSLKELYLRKNMISNFNELRYLQDLEHLRTLSLTENPVADHPQYRLVVIALLPQITKLDNKEVTNAEVDKAEQINIDDILSQPIQFKNHQKQPMQKAQSYYQNDFNSEEQLINKKIGAKVQRSPPQKFNNELQQEGSPKYSPRNQFEDMQIGGGVGGAGKVKHSPKNQQQNNEVVWPSGQNISPKMRQQYHKAHTQFENSPYEQEFQFKNKKKEGGSREQIRNENILCAIISLMRELDKSGLEFVKKDCEKRLNKME